MKLLTIDEIRAASHNLESAIRCSILHWEQILELGPAGYLRTNKIGIGGEFCALCWYQKRNHPKTSCKTCVLHDGKYCCCYEYQDVADHLQLDSIINPQENWAPDALAAITAMIDKLKACLVDLPETTNDTK